MRHLRVDQAQDEPDVIMHFHSTGESVGTEPSGTCPAISSGHSDEQEDGQMAIWHS